MTTYHYGVLADGQGADAGELEAEGLRLRVWTERYDLNGRGLGSYDTHAAAVAAAEAEWPDAAVGHDGDLLVDDSSRDGASRLAPGASRENWHLTS